MQLSRADAILALVTPMRIAEDGRLEYFDQTANTFRQTALIESHRHLIYPYTPVKEVGFLIIHYDAFPNQKADGKPGTVQNTVANLNDIRMASIHYCVDSYPVTDENAPGQGMGIIMATLPSDPPYKARHTAISINPERGLDPNSQNTADLMTSLGIVTGLTIFNQDKAKDMDSVSLGIEQSGRDFSKAFPLNMPAEREIANLLSLTAAVSKRYDLKIWDLLGHNEIQQKPDPGNEYMTIVRLLLARLYQQNPELFPNDFLRDEPADFFSKLKAYATALLGPAGYQNVLNWLSEDKNSILRLEICPPRLRKYQRPPLWVSF